MQRPCGRRPRPRTPSTATCCTSRSWWLATPSTPCPWRRSRLRRPRRGPRPDRHRGPGPRPSPVERPGGARHRRGRGRRPAGARGRGEGRQLQRRRGHHPGQGTEAEPGMTENPLASGRGPGDPAPTAMVVFGGSGDLAHRKIVPAFYNLELHRLPPQNFAFVGTSRSEFSDEGTGRHAQGGRGVLPHPAHPAPGVGVVRQPPALHRRVLGRARHLQFGSATCSTASTASTAPTATGRSTCR